MHRTDDPNMPPPRLLDALSRFSRKEPSPYTRRTLADHVIDEIARDIAHDQRAAMVKNDDPNLPPLRLRLALRRHGRNRPYCHRRLSWQEVRRLPLTEARRLYLIDPPSHYAPIQEWREFLRGMEEHEDRDHWQISRTIEDARQRVRELEALESTPHLMWWR